MLIITVDKGCVTAVNSPPGYEECNDVLVFDLDTDGHNPNDVLVDGVWVNVTREFVFTSPLTQEEQDAINR